MSEDLRAEFAEWCRSLRGYGSCREHFTDTYGLKHRAVQDLEQGRTLPSRSLVMLLTAIEMDPAFMREVAQEAKPRLGALDRARANRNKIDENRKALSGGSNFRGLD